MALPKILGISASPRRPWPGPGQSSLVESLEGIADQAGLMEYITRQADLCLESFMEAGRAQGQDFHTIYKNLRKMTKSPGLSNSELALAAGLWAAASCGAAVRHVPLSAHFPIQGGLEGAALLRENLLWADGLLISGPVYFGDRSSMVKGLLDCIAADPELKAHLRGKLYGGSAVGAKRNGGQETTLIYQLVDMLEMGMLGVGNDSQTTAQYGGTCHAGDVGTISRDAAGLETAMGVGRRMARVLSLMQSGRRLRTRPKALVLLLQDVRQAGLQCIRTITSELQSVIDFEVLDLTGITLKRCFACDICPANLETDDVYRCLVKDDDMRGIHPHFLDHDMLVPVVVSARDPSRTVGDYQIFMERTRYLRRGDYVWSDVLVAPVVVQEPGAISTYPLRMLTSLIRHHTVMSRPLVATLSEGGVADAGTIVAGLRDAGEQAARLAAGRLAMAHARACVGYNPVGYVLSAHKELEDAQVKKRERLVAARVERWSRMAAERLAEDGECE